MHHHFSFFSLLATLVIALAGLSSEANAQNLQIHYDMGRYVYPQVQRTRPHVTATVEHASADRWGDTFYFVDMSFLQQGGVSAMWKFMRNLRFWKGPIAWHVRYDGGLKIAGPKNNVGISLNDAFMTGASYSYRTSDRRLMLTGGLLYKYIKGLDQPHSGEAYGVWNYRFGIQNMFCFSGFFTLWFQRDLRPGWDSTMKFVSQPQFWFNLNSLPQIADDFRLSFGSELRISAYVDAPQWIFAPTLALKWTF